MAFEPTVYRAGEIQYQLRAEAFLLEFHLEQLRALISTLEPISNSAYDEGEVTA